MVSISAFFKDTLGARLNNSRWSWGAHNSDLDYVVLRVWQDDIKHVDGAERVLVLDKNWGGSSSGHEERRLHIEAVSDGADWYGIACVGKQDPGTRKKSIASFFTCLSRSDALTVRADGLFLPAVG